MDQASPSWCACLLADDETVCWGWTGGRLRGGGLV